jgi:hypothetical protein
MASLRVTAVLVSLAACIAPVRARADTVVQFDGLNGLVDTYDESGFHFDGGEPCFYFCPAIPEGIGGNGNLNTSGSDPFGYTSFLSIDVTRPDAASFELVSVDLVGYNDVNGNLLELGISSSISFVGLYQGGGSCYLGGVSNLAPPLIPSTLVFASCPGIDSVSVGGTGLRITTDDWTFRVVPEPATAVLLGAGIACVAARVRAGAAAPRARARSRS